jgi:hypothetical protein
MRPASDPSCPASSSIPRGAYAAIGSSSHAASAIVDSNACAVSARFKQFFIESPSSRNSRYAVAGLSIIAGGFDRA